MAREVILQRKKNDGKYNAEVKIWFEDGTVDSGYQGCFEFWDEKTGGNLTYLEGRLNFEGIVMWDYDGCIVLPSMVGDLIVELGFYLGDI